MVIVSVFYTTRKQKFYFGTWFLLLKLPSISLSITFSQKQTKHCTMDKKNFADEKSIGNANVHQELISISLSVWDWMV